MSRILSTAAAAFTLAALLAPRAAGAASPPAEVAPPEGTAPPAEAATERVPAAAPADDTAAAQPDGDDAERRRLEQELAASLGATTPPPQATPPPAFAPGRLLPDISLVGSFVASYFSDEPTLRFPAHEPTHRGPELQELELALQSNIDPHFRGDVFLAISLDGIEVEEAYFTTLGLPWNLQVRGGAFYAPFGRFNQQHFLEVSPFADMPLPNRRFFGGEQLRGVGAEASVLVPLPFFLELRASLQTAGNEVSFGVPAEEIRDLGDMLAVGRALSSFDLGERLTLNLGVSAATGPNASRASLAGDDRTAVFGGDLYLKLRDESSQAFTALQSEYLYRRATVPGGTLEQGGAYAWIVRRFSAQWEAAVRYDALGLPAGSAQGAPAIENEELAAFLAPARQQRVGAALTHFFSEFSRLRLQANYDFGLAPPGESAEAVAEIFLQFQFVLGAHGAHPF